MIEPVWCPVLGMDEEEALKAAEEAEQALLVAVRAHRAPVPIGVKRSEEEDDDEAMHSTHIEGDDDEDEEELIGSSSQETPDSQSESDEDPFW